MPDVEALHKQADDRQYGAWEKYLLKTADHLKKEQRLTKKANELQAYALGKRYDKREKVQANRKSLPLDMQAHHEKLNLAMENISEKVAKVEKNRKMFQMKHREVETLKF